MKRSFIIMLTVVAGIILLQACVKDIGLADAGDTITIEASVGAMTKVADTGFTAGDRISVYGWTGSASDIPEKLVVNGVVNTFDGNTWTPEKQMLWRNLTDSHYFLGIYPERKVTDLRADPFTLDAEDHMASDLLVATNLDGVTFSDGAVALAFDHIMAKLVVNLKFRSEWDEVPVVTHITTEARITADVDYLNKKVTATGEISAVSIPAASSAPEGYDASYSGILIPQTDVRKITFTIDGKEYVYESADDIPLNPGKYTTLGLNVGRDRIEFESVSIVEWPAEADIVHIEALRDPSLSWESDGDVFQYVYAETPLTIKIKIKRLVANHPLEVPITITDESGAFSLSTDKICFDAGEYEKTIEVSYKYSELEFFTDYSFSLSFDDELGGPGCFSTFVGTGKKIPEYEDYMTGWYSGRWQVNAAVTAFEWVDGPIIDDLDSDTWILQRAKGTTNYYKMIIWDGLAEIEFMNPGDGSLVFNKNPGYNDFVSKWSGGQFDWTFNHKESTWLFQTRANRCVISCSGEELKSGDCIELEGWVAKDEKWLGEGYNMYLDFDIR